MENVIFHDKMLNFSSKDKIQGKDDLPKLDLVYSKQLGMRKDSLENILLRGSIMGKWDRGKLRIRYLSSLRNIF